LKQQHTLLYTTESQSTCHSKLAGRDFGCSHVLAELTFYQTSHGAVEWVIRVLGGCTSDIGLSSAEYWCLQSGWASIHMASSGNGWKVKWL